MEVATLEDIQSCRNPTNVHSVVIQPLAHILSVALLKHKRRSNMDWIEFFRGVGVAVIVPGVMVLAFGIICFVVYLIEKY